MILRTYCVAVLIILCTAYDAFSQCGTPATLTGQVVVCAGTNGSYTTDTGKQSYVWTASGGGTITQNGLSTASIQWSTPGLKTVTISYFDQALGCSRTAQKDVMIPGSVSVSGANIVCQNQSVVYSTEAGYPSYMWTVIGGNITAGQGTNSITVTWAVTLGVNRVDVNMEGGQPPCMPKSATFPVTVHPVSASISGSASACPGNTYTYTTQANNTNYNWSISGGTIQSGQGQSAVNVSWTAGASRSISVSYTAQNGCTTNATANKSVTIVEPPALPVINGTQTVCPELTDYTYTTLAGMSGYSWSFTGGGSNQIISGQGTNAVTVRWSSSASIRVTYTNGACGPASPGTLPVTVVSIPNASISGGSFILCLGPPATFTAPAGYAAYNWGVDGGTIVSGAGTNTISVTWPTSGRKTLTLNYGMINGCQTVNASRFVDIFDRPTPIINGSSAPICQGATQAFWTETGKTNYQWTITGGVILSGSTTNSIVVQWQTPGTQTLTVSYNNNICTPVAPGTRSQVVNGLPEMTGPSTTSFCSPQALSFPLTTSIPSVSYQWTHTANANVTGESSGSSSSPVLTNGVLTNTTQVPQTVIYQVRAVASGCTGPNRQYEVTVNPRPTTQTTISGSATVCMDITNNVYTAAPGYANYVWNMPNPQSGIITPGPNPNTISVAWNQGSHILEVTYSSPEGCAYTGPTINKSISAGTLTQPVVTANNPSFCAGGSALLSTQAVAPQYQWQLNGSDILGATTYTYTATIHGSYSVKTSNAWCQKISEPVVISAGTASTITTLPIAGICPNQTAYLDYSSTTGSPTQYRIDWASGIPDVAPTALPSNQQIILSNVPVTPGTYTGILYADNTNSNCGSTGTPISITVKPNPIITSPGTAAICSGATFAPNLTADVPTTTFISVVTTVSPSISGVAVGAYIPGNAISNTLSNSNTSAGTVVYRVQASAAGCTGPLQDLTVTVNGKINAATVGINQTICPGGDPAAFTQTGTVSGPGTLSYEWKSSTDNVNFAGLGVNTSLYNVPAGVTQTTYYKRVVTSYSNGIYCSADSGNPITITVPAINPGSISGDQTICTGGDPVALSQTPATGPGTLTYQWQKSTTGPTSGYSSAGVATAAFDPPGPLNQTTYYKRKVTSSSCALTAETNYVTITPEINSTISPAYTTLCSPYLPSIYLSVVSVSNYVYTWKRNGTTVASGTGAFYSSYQATQAGSYTVTITSPSGCTVTSTAATVVQSNGVGSIFAPGDLCLDGYVDLIAGEGVNYQWSTGETTQTIRVYDPGTYSVSYFNGCQVSASRVITLNPPPGQPCIFARQAAPGHDGIEKVNVDKLTLHPNPAQHELTITLPEPLQESLSISLHDSFGRLVHESALAGGEQTNIISTGSLADGIYFLQLKGKTGKAVTRKVIVKH